MKLLVYEQIDGSVDMGKHVLILPSECASKFITQAVSQLEEVLAVTHSQ